MLPGEIQAAIAGNPAQQQGYQAFKDWVAAGAKHGSYAGLMPNEAVVRVENTPWGENIAYDAAGNAVSQYRAPRAGEVSPYGGAVAPGSGGPSAPMPGMSTFAAPTAGLLPAGLLGATDGANPPYANPGLVGAINADLASGGLRTDQGPSSLLALLSAPEGQSKSLAADQLAALRKALQRMQFQIPS